MNSTELLWAKTLEVLADFNASSKCAGYDGTAAAADPKKNVHLLPTYLQRGRLLRTGSKIDYSSCAFMETNLVMKNYAEVLSRGAPPYQVQENQELCDEELRRSANPIKKIKKNAKVISAHFW